MWKKEKSSNRKTPNPGHRPGFLPNFLSDQGINTIISGGMGGGAVEIFKEKGIEVVIGARGNADDAVRSYLQGNLQTSGSICHEHQHSHECEDSSSFDRPTKRAVFILPITFCHDIMTIS
jgi:predicted Fe-Mo cluster-binding NifX family protein